MLEVQEYTLMLMKELDDICRKYKIIYYLAGGSVIGSLRHKGFIPWDDDMDIYMTRANWEKFKIAFRNENIANRILECSDINMEYPNMVAKYVSMETTAVYRNLLLQSGKAGIVLDILILDPVPDDQEKIKKHLDTLLLYSEIVNPFYVYTHRFNTKSKYKRYWWLRKFLGKEYFVKKLERELMKYSEEECSKFVLRWGGVPHLFDKKLFGNPKYLTFEDTILPVPEKSYLYLSQLYGEDWIYIPSHDDEITHVCIFNLEVGDEEFYEEYLPRLNQDSYLNHIFKRKLNRLKVGESFRTIQDQTCRLHANRVAIKIEQLDDKYKLKEAFLSGDYVYVEDSLQEYLKLQCSSEFLGNKFFGGLYRYMNPVFVPISDEVLWVVIEVLMRKGSTYKARRILEAREAHLGKLPDELELQKQMIQYQNHASDLFEQREFDEALEQLEQGLKEKPDWINFLKLKIRILLREENVDSLSVEDLLKKGIEVAPNDGEWLKYQGDIARLHGEMEKALALYSEAISATQNGYIQLEVKEIFKQEFERVIAEIENKIEQQNFLEAYDCLEDKAMYYSKYPMFLWYWYWLKLKIENQQAELFSLIVKIKTEKRNLTLNQKLELLRIAWEKMGLNGKEVARRAVMWNCIEEGCPLEQSVYDELERDLTSENQKLLGDYAISQGRYEEAYERYHQALEQPNCSDLVRKELFLIYKRDMQYFVKGLSGGYRLLKTRQYFKEWKVRYKNKERWLKDIKCLGLDVYMGSELFDSTRGEEIVLNTAQWDDFYQNNRSCLEIFRIWKALSRLETLES